MTLVRLPHNRDLAEHIVASTVDYDIGEMSTWQEISRDKEFLEMRRNVDIKFEHVFAQAYKSYIAGDWAAAGAEFERLHRVRPEDGPTAALTEIIVDQHKGVAPADWKGYRPLTRKS